MGDPYLYTPLGVDAIRLLRLKNSPSHEALEITFAQQQLLSVPGGADLPANYRAVSYTWHPEPADPVYEPVLCEGKTIQVTQNVANLLRRVRGDSDQALWIDQLCIDQTNDAERATQVALMAQVYQQCQSVIFWMGEESVDTQAAFALLQGLPKAPTEPDEALPMPSFIYNDDYMREKGLPSLRSGGWWPLMELLERSVLRRLWIVQELVLAPTVQVRCGSHTMSFDVFGSATVFLGLSGWISHLQIAYVQTHPELYRGLHLSQPHLIDNIGGIEYIGGIFNRRCIFQGGISEGLEQLLGTVRKFKMGKGYPSDRIYALLGMLAAGMPDGRVPPALLPSYAKPFTEVYRDTTRYLLEQGSVAILSQVEDPSLRLSDVDLPSWVPNFNVFQNGAILGLPIQAALMDFMAGWDNQLKATWDNLGEEEPVTCTFDRSDVLVVDAYRVDHVRLTGPAGFKQGLFFEFLDESARLVDLSQAYPGGGNVVDAFWRTLIANVDATTKVGKPATGNMLKHFAGLCLQAAASMQWHKEIEQLRAEGHLAPNGGLRPAAAEVAVKRLQDACPEDKRVMLLVKMETNLLPFFPFALQTSAPGLYNVFTLGVLSSGVPPAHLAATNASFFQRMAEQVCCFRRLFTTTDRGFLGCGPKSLERGDEIYILRGARVPFVLRKAREMENEFQLIGECYVHGIMQGETCRGENFKWSQIRIF